MSKGVQDRIQRSRSVVLAGYLYAGVFAEAFKRQRHGFRHHPLLRKKWQRIEQWLAEQWPAEQRLAETPTGPSSLTIGYLFRFIAMDIEERGEVMVARDEDLARRRAELRRERRRRDRLAQEVYRELSQIRNFFVGILGYQQGCAYLDLKGPTPRDPFVLMVWARCAAEVLADAEKSPARDYAKGGKLKTSELAERLATGCTALQQAIDAVIMAGHAEVAPLEAQRKAIAAFDKKHKQGARVFEAALDFFGLPSLAETVRPGVKRRGRPCKQRLVDVYPDLVARVLGEEHLRRIEQRSRELKEADSRIEEGSRELKAADPKIEKGSRKLQAADPKIENGSRKLEVADPKIETASRKLKPAVLKIEKPVRKLARRASSPAFVGLTPPGRRPCRGIVQRLESRCRPRQRPVRSDPAPAASTRLHQVAAAWWRRLRRPASGSL